MPGTPPLRIFLGFAEIAGYYHSLATGFRRLGHPCVFVSAYGHRFSYGGDEATHLWVRLMRWCGTGRVNTPKSLKKVLFAVAFELSKLPVLVWALLNFDVFIFGFGSTFYGFRELPLLKALGKKVVYVFHGSDSRPPYMDGAVMSSANGYSPAQCVQLTARKKAVVRAIDRHADLIVEQAAAGHLHERPFVQYLAVGLPFWFDPAPPRPAGAAVRILHSPSNPEGKGTELIRQAIRSLQAKGLAIDWVEITGQPNAVVVQELMACDLVVDQAYSDSPMAGFATEAAWFGKPAVVGGYYAQVMAADVPEEARPPSAFCTPERLEETIEWLVRDADYRRELGARAEAFVRSRWTPEAVAGNYLRLLSGDIPAAWTFDPAHSRYFHGYGMPEAKVRGLIRAVVEAGGPGALQLDDKPAVRDAMLAFAAEG